MVLSSFVHKKLVIIIADSCFKSKEIDFENKVEDLSGYFSTQNNPIDYWAVLKKAKKGCWR